MLKMREHNHSYKMIYIIHKTYLRFHCAKFTLPSAKQHTENRFKYCIYIIYMRMQGFRIPPKMLYTDQFNYLMLSYILIILKVYKKLLVNFSPIVYNIYYTRKRIFTRTNSCNLHILNKSFH